MLLHLNVDKTGNFASVQTKRFPDILFRKVARQMSGYLLGKVIEQVRMFVVALQLPFPQVSESMGNHDSKIVDAASVD